MSTFNQQFAILMQTLVSANYAAVTKVYINTDASGQNLNHTLPSPHTQSINYLEYTRA